jgi:hypothetical protein
MAFRYSKPSDDYSPSPWGEKAGGLAPAEARGTNKRLIGRGWRLARTRVFFGASMNGNS